MLIFDIKKFDEQRVYLLQGRIGSIKDFLPLDPEWSHKGSRYNDNERISRLVLGYIIEETLDQDKNRNYKAANSKFLSLDTNQIDPYIHKAVQEAADADFYYTFEKEY